jgi:adenylate cyclase
MFKPVDSQSSVQTLAATSLRRCLALLLAGLLTLAVAGLCKDARLGLDESVGSLGWRWWPQAQPEERLWLVAIDERSLDAVGPWPWPREVMARLSQRLFEAGAALQVYDVVFPETKPGDDEFLSALQQTRSVIAQIPVMTADAQAEVTRKGLMGSPMPNVSCQQPVPVATGGYLASHRVFGSVPKGHITPIVGADGVIRSQSPLICVDGKAYPSLALQALLTGLGGGNSPLPGNRLQVIEGGGWMQPSWELRINDYLGYRLPLDAGGNMRVSYRADARAYSVISAADLLSGEPLSAGVQSALTGSWVMVGATAFGLGDVVTTPHAGQAPGVELQLRMLQSLLDDTVPYTPAGVSAIWLLECLVFAGLLLLLAGLRHRWCMLALPVAGVVLPLLAWTLHTYLLFQHVWLGWTVPALFGLLGAVCLLLLEQRRIQLEHSRFFHHLSTYLPRAAAREIAYSVPSGEVQARREELVLMCADLRNFSAYEAAHAPEDAAALLHRFFVQAARVVSEFGGEVAEFNGDAVLVSWSAAADPSQPLAAAEKLLQVMSAELPGSLAVGMAIEKGSVLVGSIGPASRRLHALLGETVTMTLRMQAMTQELAQPILVGESAARALKHKHLVSQGSFLLDGLRLPCTIYAPSETPVPEPLGPESEPLGPEAGPLESEAGWRVISGGRGA